MRPPEPNDQDLIGQEGSALDLAGVDTSWFSSSSNEATDLGDTDSFCEKVVFVKTKKVGYLIGHHGRTIWGFESSSGAKIDITTPNSRADETPIKVSGTRESVSKAISMIMDLFALNNYSSKQWLQVHSSIIDPGRGNLSFRPATHQEQHIGNEEVTVPANAIALGLLTKDNICALEQMFGSKLLVQQVTLGSPFVADTEFITVNVVGTARSNRKTIRALGCLLDRAAVTAAAAAAAAAFPAAKVGQTELVIRAGSGSGQTLDSFPTPSTCFAEYDGSVCVMGHGNQQQHDLLLQRSFTAEDISGEQRRMDQQKSNWAIWADAVADHGGLQSY